LQRQLAQIEEDLQRKELSKQEKLARKLEELRLHSEQVQVKHLTVKEQLALPNTEVLRRDLEKMNRSVKNREDILRRDLMELKLKNQKRAEAHGSARKDLARSVREQQAYYEQKQKLRDQLIEEVREALREDNDKKKELAALRKQDQEENYMRSMNFHKMYKQKLLEKLEEKRERAERIKEQQRRIAEMCNTVRTIDPVSGTQTVTHRRGQSLNLENA